MPTSINSSPNSDLVVYVPVHAEYSQVEYVAPFLQQYPGSKVFVYKWNGRRDKMINYFAKSKEFAGSKLGVYDFTLKNILHCILNEPPNRKVVFLLTASMAYCFGEYQRNLLLSIQSCINEFANNLELDGKKSNHFESIQQAESLRDRVWGVSVIGHCMYGCMSCKGNDHKVPVYYSRYFRGEIPYTRHHIREQFKLASSPIPVLCAPSTGETTVLLQRDVLHYLKDLQDQGHFKFVWKFHPAVYNPASYNLAIEVDRTEYENVQWIMSHFEHTREDEPCLLPFIEAFDLIFCDLHSSVPFIASYFSPKSIICFWNDADYEVPAGRDQAFLSNLHVFKKLSKLRDILAPGKRPHAMGDIKFFWSQYGKVDGHEVERFASLANWPTVEHTAVAQNGPVPDLNPFFCQLLANTTLAWDQLLEQVENRHDAPADEDLFGDMLQAMGLFKDTPMLPRKSNRVSTPDLATATPLVANIKTCEPKTLYNMYPPTTKFSVMTFNLWIGTEGCFSKQMLAGASEKVNGDVQPTSDIRYPDLETQKTLARHAAEAIIKAGADVVGCQEVAPLIQLTNATNNHMHSDSVGKTKTAALERIVSHLKDITGDQNWSFVFQGILTPEEKSCCHPLAIITRLKVLKVSPKKFGICVEIPSNQDSKPCVWAWNIHLGYKPYGPYQVEKPKAIPYEDIPPAPTPNEAIAMSIKTRGPQLAQLIEDMKSVGIFDSMDNVSILTGDFNEPSHLDWTNAAAISGYHGTPVQWPSTQTLAKAEFIDSARMIHSDPVSHPMFTWNTINHEFPMGDGEPEGFQKPGDKGRDVHDRIDMVLHRGNNVHPIEARVVGPLSISAGTSIMATKDDIITIPRNKWISDHRAVVVTYEV